MLEVDGRGQDIVLTDLVAGVMYWVRVEANGDIPGPASSPVNFTITGMTDRMTGRILTDIMTELIEY